MSAARRLTLLAGPVPGAENSSSCGTNFSRGEKSMRHIAIIG
jgi:hypothetical protein